MSQFLLVACGEPLLGEPQANATALDCFAVADPGGIPLTSCLPSEPVDVANFDPERDAQVSIHIDEADGVTDCAQLVADTSLGGESGASDGEQVSVPSATDANECIVRRDPSDGVVFLEAALVDPAVCIAGVQFRLLDIALPLGSLVCMEYVVALE